MRENRFHHVINRIGAMSDREKALMVQYADATGLSVPDLIALAWREYAVGHAGEIEQAIENRAVIENIAVQ